MRRDVLPGTVFWRKHPEDRPAGWTYTIVIDGNLFALTTLEFMTAAEAKDHMRRTIYRLTEGIS